MVLGIQFARNYSNKIECQCLQDKVLNKSTKNRIKVKNLKLVKTNSALSCLPTKAHAIILAKTNQTSL